MGLILVGSLLRSTTCPRILGSVSLGQRNVHCVGNVLLKTVDVHEIRTLEVCEVLERVSVIRITMSKESRLPRALD